MIWGVDLGMRSLYLFSEEEKFCLAAPKTDRYTEIRILTSGVSLVVDENDTVFYEEPVLAGPRNIRTIIGLAQSSAALLAGSPGHCYEVPVATWKKKVVGRGNANKDEVKSWLRENDRETFDRCNNNQNFIDAACIQKYGIDVMSTLRSVL